MYNPFIVPLYSFNLLGLLFLHKFTWIWHCGMHRCTPYIWRYSPSEAYLLEYNMSVHTDSDCACTAAHGGSMVLYCSLYYRLHHAQASAIRYLLVSVNQHSIFWCDMMALLGFQFIYRKEYVNPWSFKQWIRLGLCKNGNAKGVTTSTYIDWL